MYLITLHKSLQGTNCGSGDSHVIISSKPVRKNVSLSFLCSYNCVKQKLTVMTILLLIKIVMMTVIMTKIMMIIRPVEVH